MEPEMIKTILIYVAGGGIGGAIGAVLGVWIGLKVEAKKKIKTNMSEDPNQESTDINLKEWVKKEYDKTVETDELNTTLKPQPELPKKPKVKVKPVDYNAISRKNGSSKPDLTELAKEKLGEKETEEVLASASSPDAPYVISLESYANEFEEHQKINITYYEKDDVFTDQNNDVISNPERLVGMDAILKLGQESGDPDTVYIRNLKLETDYELIRLKKSYAKEKLGYDEPETKKPSKGRNSRRTRKTTDVDDETGEDD